MFQEFPTVMFDGFPMEPDVYLEHALSGRIYSYTLKTGQTLKGSRLNKLSGPSIQRMYLKIQGYILNYDIP